MKSRVKITRSIKVTHNKLLLEEKKDKLRQPNSASKVTKWETATNGSHVPSCREKNSLSFQFPFSRVVYFYWENDAVKGHGFPNITKIVLGRVVLRSVQERRRL